MRTKNAGWLGLAALLAIVPIRGYSQTPDAPPISTVAPAQVTLSPGAAEVVKLAQSGVSDDVVLAYVQNSQAAFTLSSDNVVYLKDVGLSPAVITAMLNHDSALNHLPQYTYDQKLYPATNPPPAPTPVPPPDMAQAATDQPPVATPDQTAQPPVYDNNPPPEVNYFYNDLSPYGSWVNLPGYGWCWQPSTVVINHGWRPYCDGGHWIYSDAGWFWQSDYSWGWAPFHYGRWRLDERCGWVWFPDRVWGPAWVTWRSSGDHCGWAPLPLHAVFDVGGGFRFNGVHVGANFDFGLGVNLFTFVGVGDFCDHDVWRHRLPPAEVTRIYNHTTIINNYTVENKMVVNRGIDVNRVSEASHTTIQRVSVRDVRAGGEIPRGGAGVVYRHELGAPVRTGPIVAQRLDDRHPVIQHNTVAAVHVESRVTPVNTVPHPQPAPRAPQTMQPQREIHTTPQSPPGNQRYTPQNLNQNQSAPQNQEHRTGITFGATTPATPAPKPPVTPVVPEQHYTTTPNEAPKENVAPQTRVEQPNLVTHTYVTRSTQAMGGHYTAPASQSAPAQSQPHYQQGNSGGNGNGNNGGNGNSSGGHNGR